MGWFDSIKSIGSKFVGAVESVGSKGLHTINTIGQKAKSVGESLIKNPAVEGFLLANPELGGLATGALGALDTGLAISGAAEKGLKALEGSGILKSKDSSSKPMSKAPITAERPSATAKRQDDVRGGRNVSRQELGSETNVNPRLSHGYGRRHLGSKVPNAPSVSNFAVETRGIIGKPKSKQSLGDVTEGLRKKPSRMVSR